MDRKTALGDEVSGRWGRTTADVVDETRRLAVTDWLGRVVSLFMFILFAGVQCSESERRRQQDERRGRRPTEPFRGEPFFRSISGSYAQTPPKNAKITVHSLSHHSFCFVLSAFATCCH